MLNKDLLINRSTTTNKIVFSTSNGYVSTLENKIKLPFDSSNGNYIKRIKFVSYNGKNVIMGLTTDFNLFILNPNDLTLISSINIPLDLIIDPKDNPELKFHDLSFDFTNNFLFLNVYYQYGISDLPIVFSSCRNRFSILKVNFETSECKRIEFDVSESIFNPIELSKNKHVINVAYSNTTNSYFVSFTNPELWSTFILLSFDEYNSPTHMITGQLDNYTYPLNLTYDEILNNLIFTEYMNTIIIGKMREYENGNFSLDDNVKVLNNGNSSLYYCYNHTINKGLLIDFYSIYLDNTLDPYESNDLVSLRDISISYSPYHKILCVPYNDAFIIAENNNLELVTINIENNTVLSSSKTNILTNTDGSITDIISFMV